METAQFAIDIDASSDNSASNYNYYLLIELCCSCLPLNNSNNYYRNYYRKLSKMYLICHINLKCNR